MLLSAKVLGSVTCNTQFWKGAAHRRWLEWRGVGWSVLLSRGPEAGDELHSCEARASVAVKDGSW